jgi:hypothetical protein
LKNRREGVRQKRPLSTLKYKQETQTKKKKEKENAQSEISTAAWIRTHYFVRNEPLSEEKL